MSQPCNTPSETASPCFEDALAQLETIVQELEEGQIGLAEALSRYEAGVHLLKHCYGLLETTQRKIEVLTGVDANGNPLTEPFNDPAGDTLEEKVKNRGQRRSKPAKPLQSRGLDNVDESGALF